MRAGLGLAILLSTMVSGAVAPAAAQQPPSRFAQPVSGRQAQALVTEEQRALADARALVAQALRSAGSPAETAEAERVRAIVERVAQLVARRAELRAEIARLQAAGSGPSNQNPLLAATGALRGVQLEIEDWHRRFELPESANSARSSAPHKFSELAGEIVGNIR